MWIIYSFIYSNYTQANILGSIKRRKNNKTNKKMQQWNKTYGIIASFNI